MAAFTGDSLLRVPTEPGVAVLRISALRGPPSDVVRAEVEAEGARLLEFLAPDAADRRVDWAAGRRRQSPDHSG